ncbi:Hypothetical protein PHPALM_11783 [Phytophthora palmivora]|uniref:M96 mating-specific protein family n=1 Tax=Phytophthora palmivora TaxID=4796 RepID=A0A2P4Y1C3_9STRA|nr:Hypothetical protein PHPALM_11783 [Phytophthora palmivora]
MKSTTLPEPSKPTSRKRRSTSWLRRKQELNALRSESEALETHLTFLQMELDRRKAYQQKPTIQDQGMWQSVAIIARQECQNSQNENARLKEKVQLYAQASKMLQDQLTVAETRRMQLLGSPFAFVRVGVTQTPMLCFENDEIFKMLERRINDRFHELDLILREAHRPTEGGTTTEQVQICREGGQDAAAAVEFRHVRLLPFGEDTMARSLWEIIALGGVVLKTNTRVVRNTPDMIELVSCHGVPFGNNGSVSANAHTIIKRFAVPTGMVALIEAHSEWSIDYPSSEVLRSTTEEGGWVVVHEYPLKAKRRSTSWLRRKQELQALRCESDALETQVTFLQLQRDHYNRQRASAKLTEGQLMWKSVAEIAKRECQSAQDENMRLKHELQAHARASEMLQAQLTTANSQQPGLFDSKSAFANAVRVGIIMTRRLINNDGGFFDLLERKVEDRVFELDSIVSEACLPVLEGATEHIQVCREDNKEAAATVEFKHSRLLPFGEDTTAKTIWEIIELGGLITDKSIRVTRRDVNVVGMASRFTVPLDRCNDHTVSVDVHAVAKRFSASVGLVVLVESRSEWSINHPTLGTWRQTTEEGGWVVVNQLARENGAAQRACQLRSAMKLRPDVPTCGSTQSTFTGNIGDIVIPSFREILSSHHQSVENFLLDSSRTIKA